MTVTAQSPEVTADGAMPPKFRREDGASARVDQVRVPALPDIKMPKGPTETIRKINA